MVIFISYPLDSPDLITLIVFILFRVLYKLFGHYGLFDHGGFMFYDDDDDMILVIPKEICVVLSK